MKTTAVLFLFAVLWLAPASAENKNQQFVTHDAFQNHTCHSSYLLKSSVCVGIMSCAWQCAIADPCASFFYVPETRRCDKCLVNLPSTNQTVALTGVSSSFYRKSWNNTAAVTVSTVTVTSSTVTVTSSYYYAGCIALVTGRNTNTTIISDNEAAKCGESCKGFPAFATKGQKCTCTEVVIVSEVNDNPSKCTSVCPGNGNEYCGEGDDNHHASLYYFNGEP